MKRINTHQAVTQFQKKRIRKIYFVSVQYHNIKNPYAVDYREVRKSLLHIDQLWENINYLKQFQISSYVELLDREAKIKEQEKALKNQIYNKDFLQDNEAYIRYKKLKEMLSEVPESDDSFEKYWMNWKNWNRIFQMQYWMEVRKLNKWKRSYSPFGMKKELSGR